MWRKLNQTEQDAIFKYYKSQEVYKLFIPYLWKLLMIPLAIYSIYYFITNIIGSESFIIIFDLIFLLVCLGISYLITQPIPNLIIKSVNKETDNIKNNDMLIYDTPVKIKDIPTHFYDDHYWKYIKFECEIEGKIQEIEINSKIGFNINDKKIGDEVIIINQGNTLNKDYMFATTKEFLYKS